MALTVNSASILAALSLVETAFPQVLAAERLIRALWAAAHPTGTEADYLAYLDTKANAAVADADTILIDLGYQRNPATGQWAKVTG